MQRLKVQNTKNSMGSSSSGSNGICDYSIGSQNLRYINSFAPVRASENPFRVERLIHVEGAS